MSASNPIDDRYEVLERLSGTGGREELRALDRTLEREVLLVRQPRAADAAERRDLREARALAAVEHPGVQRLHEVLQDEATTTLVLEPVAGETLAERLAREPEGRLPHDEVRRLGSELAEALAAVHAAGAVHRDVSPETIRLAADGRACLTGFRLSKPFRPGEITSIDYVRAAKAKGEPVVLPTHPAPEQLGGEAASERSDLFALGCVLYRALTGREAMPGFLEHGWRAPEDPARAGAPRNLAAPVMACLARSPIARPKSATALRDALLPEGRGGGLVAPRTRILAGAAALFAAAFLVWQLAPWERGTDARGLGVVPGEAPTEAGTFAPGFGRSLALLIGIGEAYRPNGFAPLENAVADVDALDAALRARPLGRWETTVLRDGEATENEIRKALAKLENELQPEDRALVYFAGHGVPHERSESSGWVVPADGLSLERDPERTSWLHFDAFERFLVDAQAKHVMVAVDCCYGGRLASTRSSLVQDFEARFLTRPARVVLAAGRADEPVFDGAGKRHSPFGQAFLDSLGDGISLTSSMLHARMLGSFSRQQLAQTPVLAHTVNVPPGEFVFLAE